MSLSLRLLCQTLLLFHRLDIIVGCLRRKQLGATRQRLQPLTDLVLSALELGEAVEDRGLRVRLVLTLDQARDSFRAWQRILRTVENRR